MISLLIAVAVAMGLSLAGTSFLIKTLEARRIGQPIREDGPAGHLTKAGTPTMGGVAIVVSAVLAYLFVHIRSGLDGFSSTGLALVGLIVGMSLVGFADDALAIRRGRNMGLNKKGKSAGLVAVAALFSASLLWLTDTSTSVSFTRETYLDLGEIAFFVWAMIMIVGSSNAVNLTDGLDGLATGSAAMVFAAFTFISFWQAGNTDVYGISLESAADVAIVAASMVGACAGFLWWNAAPARIFMGDTGSLALGGAMAGLAIVTETQLLLPVLGGLYVLETMSVVLQIVSFRMTGKRIFKMAPIHHHFELSGWPETTVIVRFWIIAGICVGTGVGLFYADFVNTGALR
jgi:phospho-N-acetylmuramoyl-pentapeptide-transferase